MSYGDANQHYTSIFLSKINSFSKKTSHIVFASNIIKHTEKIKVFSISPNGSRVIDFITFEVIFKTLFFDHEFKQATKEFNFKQKIKFILKWKYFLHSNVDLVHIHHFQTVSKTILEYFKLKNLPILVSFRGSDLITRSQNEDFYKKIKYASHIHTISRYMKSLFEDKYIDIPVSVIYRSINKISSKVKVQQIDNNTTRIISVGRLVWIKGHFYLLDALYNLKKQGLNFKLDIYGEGDLRSFYEFRIRQLNLEENVFLRGFIDNKLLKKEYINYDLAVQPSFYEALSNGLLDLIAHNIPCVISNQGGMMELIKPRVNGEIFDMNQPATLENAILRCMKLNKEKIKSYNSKFIKQFYSENELHSFNNLYNSLINM